MQTQYTGLDIKSWVKHFGRLVCVVMCKNKKGGKNQNWYLCKTTSPCLACGCPHFHHPAPHLWLVPCVSGSTEGQISLLLLFVLCWKGFTLEEGSSEASFLWADLLTLESPTAPWPCRCCLRRGTLLHMPLGLVVGPAALLPRETLCFWNHTCCLHCLATHSS